MEENDSGPGKIIRARSLKRGKVEERITERIKLEKVLGVTVSSKAALSCDNSGIIAYPAGCTVVLFNTKTEQQSHIINVNRKTITSLAFSSCGRYLVTGECGHQPAVRVWDLQSEPLSTNPGVPPQPQQIAEFLGHKYGVNCVAFSPQTKYVVSVGTQHDMIVNVWDWKNNIKIASNKVSTKVKSIDFAENGSYFVTVGNRHVKFWYLEHGKSKYKEAVPLMGRSAILGEQRNNYFCDVACGKAACGDSTYAITRSGLLCEFNSRRLLDKWVELRTTSANSITVGEKYIFVGCAEGIIRCFDPKTLKFITTMPRTHYLGVDVSLGTSITHMATPPKDAKYPDTVAITYDEINNKLTSIYNDHSIYIWDVFNITRVGKSFSFLYHSACIWGVEMSPPDSALPPGSFLTCSSDDTIRVWSLDSKVPKTPKNPKTIYPPNIYSNELLKVVYIDKELSYIKDMDISATSNSTEKTPQDGTSYDGRNGVRCIRISPDGKHLASGDRSGNIRIHDMASMKEMCKIEAHDAEVLCLEYCQNEVNHNLMASASRDRLIHVFDVNHGYEFLQTLDDHSSSITAVRFLNHSRNIQMVSCGADKSLIFRSLGELNGKPQFSRDHNATGKTTLYDMEVDTGQKHVLTACQDRNVRIYSVNTGKHTKSFKGSSGDEGTLIKVVLDRSGIYLATSCTDKSLSVYDYYSGECMATMCGHSELATGLRFTNDCKRLISASGDGCIFVWRVPHDMVVTMHARLSQQAMRMGKSVDPDILSASVYDIAPNPEIDYQFNTSQLPTWAKKQLSEESTAPPSLSKNVAQPKGRWAQRAENNSGGVMSFYSSQPLSFDRRFDGSEGSKDSSLDSGTDSKNYSEFKQTISSKQVTIARGETRRGILTDDSAIGDTAHDGDIDSDQEYRQRPVYYPTQVDSASGSEFTVTNIDQDELRKSQRKKKNLPAINIQQAASTGTYGSNDSDDDEDDASTPSGDNTDRNPMSLFSISSESLDQLVSREKYLQSTFESMSGAENENVLAATNTSISSKFLSKDRNLEVINSLKLTKNDPETMKKRKELQKRIDETKKKLENVGHTSPLKNSQSIHDLSYIPERDKWSKKTGNLSSYGQKNDSFFQNTNENNLYPYYHTNFTTNNDLIENKNYITSSNSVPKDLQLCGCLTANLSNILSYKPPKSPEKTLNDLIRPRKLKLDKTLSKYKLNKSLPVSPVSEERLFSDFVTQNDSPRKSFSYYIDLKDKNTTDQSFKQVCDDIQKFSKDFTKAYDQIEQKSSKSENVDLKDELVMESEDFDCSYEVKPANYELNDEDGNFSSDSLEEYSFKSLRHKNCTKKSKISTRRCVSSNEIYKLNDFEEELPKSESFYLNQNIRNSQDSILSDDQLEYDNYSKGSLESILSNESDCKSAPLDTLFKKPSMSYSQSVPKNIAYEVGPDLSQSVPKEFNYNASIYNYEYMNVKTVQDAEKLSNYENKFFPEDFHFRRSKSMYETKKYCLKTVETQTEDLSETKVVKKSNISEEIQKKLLKFESNAVQNKKPVSFFVDTRKKCKENLPVKKNNLNEQKIKNEMYIPTLASKNKQYKSKFCNVLNNKPEFNIEIFESGTSNQNFTLSTVNFENNKTRGKLNETSSLDRHLFAKSLFTSEKVTHKPPKSVRRNSSKTRKTKTSYEYIKKEDFYSKKSNNKQLNNTLEEKTIELNYKEKNVDIELENSNKSSEQNVILTELYDSLDKNIFCSKVEMDSLELNLNTKNIDSEEERIYDSLEYNVWNKKKTTETKNNSKENEIQFALENIKILNKIQHKIHKINNLIDVFKKNMSQGKVRTLSKVYESLSSSKSYYNDLSKVENPPIRFRRRNLSLPSFVERRFKVNDTYDMKKQENIQMEKKNYDFCGKWNKNSYHIKKIPNPETLVTIPGNLSIFSESYSGNKTSDFCNKWNKGTDSGNSSICSGMYSDSLSSYSDNIVPFRDKNLHSGNLDAQSGIKSTNLDRTIGKECTFSGNLCTDDEHECTFSGNLRTNDGNECTFTKSPKIQINDMEYGNNESEVYVDENSSPDSSLRRSCSLSDLRMQINPVMPKRKIDNVSGKKSQTSVARSNSRYQKNPNMSRSRSSTVLNASDSDNEEKKGGISRLMRPTISSNNKNKNNNLQSRKKQSYSTSNINTIGIENISTSDDDTDTKKPVAPPRNRGHYDQQHVTLRKHLNNKEKNKALRHTIHFDDTLTPDDFQSLDYTSIESPTHHTEEVIHNLAAAADNVVRLYDNLSNEPNFDHEDSQQQMELLKMSIIRTHKILHDCILRDLKSTNSNIDVNQTDTVKKLNDLVSKGHTSQNSVVNIMEQYSDILLDMVQQKIHDSKI